MGSRIKEQGFYEDYISIEQTSAVNGILTLFIFLSHSTGYLDLENTVPINDMYFVVRYYMMQLVVVTFLFYSGYGIMLSIMKKGNSYVRKFPRDRFLKVLIMMDIVVAIFFVVGLMLGSEFTVKQVLLSLIGLQDLGNSNWYIFVILVMYVLTYFAFMIFRKRNLLGIFAVFVLVAAYVWIAMTCELPSRFWNTAIMYPTGMLYAYLKEPIEKFVMKNNITYSVMFAISFFIFQFGYFTRDHGVEQYGIFCGGFMALVLLFTMKVKVVNPFLVWMGTNLFPIYMLQRLPMRIFALTMPDVVSAHPYLFIVSSFVITMALANIFIRCMEYVPIVRNKKPVKES